MLYTAGRRVSVIYYIIVRISLTLRGIIWAATWQNQQIDCAPSEDSDQPENPPSLIRVFVVRMKKAWVFSYPLNAKRRLWSDWADAQANLSLRWAHIPLCWFCYEAAQIWLLLKKLDFAATIYLIFLLLDSALSDKTSLFCCEATVICQEWFQLQIIRPFAHVYHGEYILATFRFFLFWFIIQTLHHE